MIKLKFKLIKIIKSKKNRILVKLKVICFLFFLYLIYKNKYYNYSKIQYEIKEKNIEKQFYKYFMSLKPISYENNSLLSEFRKNVLKIFSTNSNKKINTIDSLYIDYNYRFGNQLVLLNKIIFYCEILKCKKILLNNNNRIYIKNKIKDDKFNLTIEVIKESKNINLKNITLSLYFPNAYYKFLEIKPDYKFYVIKNEILKNIPFIKTKKNDLYIHIRSGDIFILPHKAYSQPPYCFYKTIINKNKFNNIFILSEDNRNPIINKLINEFPNIVFKKNKIELDISFLVYAYNIVGSESSFCMEAIKFNDYLINFYEYNIYNIREKIFHFHHLFYNYKRNYTIFLMNPSENYIKNMYIWRASRRQINIMLRDKCHNKFLIIKPKI